MFFFMRKPSYKHNYNSVFIYFWGEKILFRYYKKKKKCFFQSASNGEMYYWVAIAIKLHNNILYPIRDSIPTICCAVFNFEFTILSHFEVCGLLILYNVLLHLSSSEFVYLQSALQYTSCSTICLYYISSPNLMCVFPIESICFSYKNWRCILAMYMM